MGIALAGVFALALWAFGVSPALAENQQVQVVDTAFMPSAVAVKPNETVTWNHPATSQGHNVRFDDLSYPNPPQSVSRDPWTATRTFTAERAYRYFCEEHGSPGGVGMSGIVYVTASGALPAGAPVAAVTATPSSPRVGEIVVFNAGASTDNGSIVKHEWDLDGDGNYESNTNTSPTISLAYQTPGPKTVKVRVTDDQGLTGEATRQLTVAVPPTASFTVSPTLAQTGQTVVYNGSASSDSDGAITRYEWDLDGDGRYEVDSGASPTVSRTYASPALLTVRLRVTDSSGITGETTRSLQVSAPRQVAPPPATGGQTPAPTQLQPVSSTIKILSSQRLRSLLRRGLRFEAGVPSNGATLRATLSAGRRTLGTLRRTSLSRGRVKLTLKLSRRGKATLKKLLAKRKHTTALMKVSAGNTTTRARVRLSR